MTVFAPTSLEVTASGTHATVGVTQLLEGRAVARLAPLLPPSRGVTTFLLRCAIWALVGWLLSLHPAVPARARHALSEWRSAWKVEAPTCGVRAYGLLFRSDDCDTDPK